LGERLLCKQEVVGSIPSTSTRPPPPEKLSALGCQPVLKLGAKRSGEAEFRRVRLPGMIFEG